MTAWQTLVSLYEHEPWKDLAECKYADPTLFVLDQGYTTAKATKYCERCSVREECEEYARRTKSIGVWGGKLFTLSSAEPQELMPLMTLDDFRPQKLVPLVQNQSKPSIFGYASNFSSTPGIFGG